MMRHISIHAPCAGGDHTLIVTAANILQHFNPRPLCRGRHLAAYPVNIIINFNPRPLCRGRQCVPCRIMFSPRQFQSTPPVQGATSCMAFAAVTASDISIHAPCAGGDALSLLARRSALYFNPRPLCRGRLTPHAGTSSYLIFQSTPPVQGATLRPTTYAAGRKRFQSTPPVQGATQPVHVHSVIECMISIHAPCAGGDLPIADDRL